MAGLTSTDNLFISPLVTNYTPDALMNIDDQVQDTVVITGIRDTFTYNVSGEDVYALLNGFKVSGLSIDCRLKTKDVNMENLSVECVRRAQQHSAM